MAGVVDVARSTLCSSQGGQSGVEGRARTHDLFGQRLVRRVVATDFGWLALYDAQLGNDLGFVVAQCLGQRGELRLQGGIFALCRQGLSPVQRQVEVAATVVDTANLARRRLVVVEELAGGLIQGCLLYTSPSPRD